MISGLITAYVATAIYMYVCVARGARVDGMPLQADERGAIIAKCAAWPVTWWKGTMD